VTLQGLTPHVLRVAEGGLRFRLLVVGYGPHLARSDGDLRRSASPVWLANRWRPLDGAGTVVVIDEAVITEAGRRLREAAPAARIILFGSSARGDGGRHSDLDFLVVEPEVENVTEEPIRLRHALRDLLVPMDIVVMSELDVARWRDVPGTPVHAALADGRVLAA
jgi:predicted nucleotidyltransferase